DAEKFSRWAETVPYTARNPLFHWTHLELARYFGFTGLLNPGSAAAVYQQCSERLQEPAFSTQGLLARMQVQLVCTTDDPADDLAHHQAHAASGAGPRMLPAFRPDKALQIHDSGTWAAYLARLGEAAGTDIRTFQDLTDALRRRAEWFHAMGCRLSDHGLERMPDGACSDQAAAQAMEQALQGQPPQPEAAETFQTTLLYHLCLLYHELGWVQQFHLGAMRNANTRMRSLLGPDTGFDSIGDFRQGLPLARFLDRLDRGDRLARTILYNLNPADNAVFASMAGNFQDGRTPGKIQWGAAWWFLDQQDGIRAQLDMLSNLGLLSRFIGMLTDSRSFLSFPRHEYFRRILCDTLGAEAERGELPDDLDWLGGIVQAVCYGNAQAWFGPAD
ncbi:MAG: glucuronate isomerase, partial [Bacteroidia bacterium]|nr:glucuronate isomerase [Bacteroidia bacterium]